MQVGLCVTLFPAAAVTDAAETLLETLLKLQVTHKDFPQRAHDVALCIAFTRELEIGYKLMGRYTISYSSVKMAGTYLIAFIVTVGKARGDL